MSFVNTPHVGHAKIQMFWGGPSLLDPLKPAHAFSFFSAAFSFDIQYVTVPQNKNQYNILVQDSRTYSACASHQ